MLNKQNLSYLETGKKICSNCNVEKDACHFFKRKENGANRLRSHCKECFYLKKAGDFSENKRQEYRLAKKQRSEQYRKTNNFSKNEKSLNRSYKNKYGITLETVYEMKKIQDNKCYICKNEDKLVVDHCHKTSKVRKLLCNSCNKTLGIIKENKKTLQNMINYIDEHDVCKFCKVPCNMPHCPYTKKEESKQEEKKENECEDCEKTTKGLEKEKLYLIETIKKLQSMIK